MRTETEIQAQRQLVIDLRASGHPHAHAQADALQARHYEEQMGLVSEDVYAAACGEGEPPVGWVRGSDNLGLLRQHMPELADIDDKTLLNMLKPNDSGFRAEIYLPDPAVLGPGYTPTVVFKGSNGEVLQADGTRRETGPEDFGANNFPQAIGLKTDYYDRAMRLADTLKNYGVRVDYAGHSLGGGLVSAAVAVSGERGTTFNAAGLHPDTARRFQQENPGVEIFNPHGLITAYQVRGEVLTDGLQNNVERMDVAQRRMLGAVLKETADLVQDVPQLKQAVTRQLQSTDMPMHARASVARFVDALADGDADRMLRDLPLSAGQVRTLDARSWQDGQLVQRPAEMPLDQVLALAGPALRAVRDVQAGAHLGHEAGEIVQGAGGIAQRTLDASGDVVRAGGAHTARAASTVSEGIAWVSCNTGDALSEASAKARLAAGAVEARAVELQADIRTSATAAGGVFWQGVANLAPAGSALERFADVRVDQTIAGNLQARDAAEADAHAARQEAIRDAAAIRAAAVDVCQLMETVHVTVDRTQRNTITGATAQVDDALDQAGRKVKAVTDHAPAAGAVLGSTVATHASLNPIVNPAAAPNLAELARTLPQLSRHASAAAVEATERHLMASTVLPSLKADTDAMERESRQWLEAGKAPPQGSRGPFQDPHLNQAYAALMAGDGERLDRIALDFAKSEEGQRLLQWSDALHRQTPAIALPDLHGQRAHAAQDMTLSR